LNTDDNGELSRVCIELADKGTKKIRIAGLPPEVKELTIKECLSKYSEIISIRDELWAAPYRYKAYNGNRIAEIKLKRHLPSHITIAGNDALISYMVNLQFAIDATRQVSSKLTLPARNAWIP